MWWPLHDAWTWQLPHLCRERERVKDWDRTGSEKCLLFELSQVPYLNHPVIPARCDERVLSVPRYDVDVTVVSLCCNHAGFVRGCPAVPYANRLIHRTRGKNLVGGKYLYTCTVYKITVTVMTRGTPAYNKKTKFLSYGCFIWTPLNVFHWFRVGSKWSLVHVPWPVVSRVPNMDVLGTVTSCQPTNDRPWPINSIAFSL